MIRQLFDEKSHTYTYLISDDSSAKAALIDPVKDKASDYLLLMV